MNSNACTLSWYDKLKCLLQKKKKKPVVRILSSCSPKKKKSNFKMRLIAVCRLHIYILPVTLSLVQCLSCHQACRVSVLSRCANLTLRALLSQAPSEYEANPEMLFYRITHLSRGKQYHIWAAAVTTAGRGNISSKVTVEPAGKGGSSRRACSGVEG